MAIDREVLNQQQEAIEIKTGVYQSSDRRICVVVKVSKGKVHYLHFPDSTVQLTQSWDEKFLRDWPLFLPRYPAKRGIRSMARSISDGFKCTAEAAAVIRAILKTD